MKIYPLASNANNDNYKLFLPKAFNSNLRHFFPLPLIECCFLNSSTVNLIEKVLYSKNGLMIFPLEVVSCQSF